MHYSIIKEIFNESIITVSGIGGLDQGFIDAGFNVIWANDFDKYAVKTYKKNYDSTIVLGDINEIELSDIPNFDVLIGDHLV